MPLLSIRIPASPDGKSNVYVEHVELTKIPSFCHRSTAARSACT